MIRHATQLMWSMYGAPYIWNGNDPWFGVDCSGAVCYALRPLKVIPRDMASWQLYEFFENKKVDTPSEGCLVFYRRPFAPRISHVMYCLDGTWCIGAQGGDSTTTTIEKARDKNACVKLLHIDYRDDIFGFTNPFMEV